MFVLFLLSPTITIENADLLYISIEIILKTDFLIIKIKKPVTLKCFLHHYNYDCLLEFYSTMYIQSSVRIHTKTRVSDFNCSLKLQIF